MNKLLEQIIDNCRKYTKDGNVATYIPELKKANKDNLGICVVTDDNTMYTAGDYEVEFTMQSVIKPIILLLALMDKKQKAIRSLDIVEMDVRKAQKDDSFRIDRCIDYMKVNFGFYDSNGHEFVFSRQMCFD